jgi:hypothetical protein
LGCHSLRRKELVTELRLRIRTAGKDEIFGGFHFSRQSYEKKDQAVSVSAALSERGFKAPAAVQNSSEKRIP